MRFMAKLSAGRGVTAVTVSAVVLPSGPAVLFAVSEQEPPFLSQVATVKSSEYFAMLSKGPLTVWQAPDASDLEVGVEIGPLIVGRHVGSVISEMPTPISCL